MRLAVGGWGLMLGEASSRPTPRGESFVEVGAF
jgi:hypothetical protein